MGQTTTPEKPFVLVVESDCHRRRTLAAELRCQGCYVGCSSSGADALQYVLEYEPDVVISGWELDDMKGLDLARRLILGSFTPRIFLEKEGADWRALRRTLECGGEDVLPRPASSERLIQLLRGRPNGTVREAHRVEPEAWARPSRFSRTGLATV